VRLTGGEPLLRRDLFRLIERLSHIPQIEDVALTTNGLRLRDHAKDLFDAGLNRLTLSLDTLDANKFRKLTRRDGLRRVIAGVKTANQVGFTGSKINTVLMRGVNDKEIPQLIEFAQEHQHEIRFIEYMDVGGAKDWNGNLVISHEEILAAISQNFGEITSVNKTDSAPANRFKLSDGTTFGIIASTTKPFCSSCDRSRLTADGQWFHCLYNSIGVNLRDLLRNDKLDELREVIKHAWSKRADQAALDLSKLDLNARQASGEDPDNPHLGMHVKGG